MADPGDVSTSRLELGVLAARWTTLWFWTAGK